jgi:hypothetical protein
MFMLPEVWRAVILLAWVPKGAEVRVHFGIAGSMENSFQWVGVMGDIDEPANTVTFTRCTRANVVAADKVLEETLIEPLDHVRTVLKKPDGWLVAIRRYQ